MARTKPWVPRIPQILQAVESSEVPYWTRPEIEQLFGIGRSAAWELMQLVGVSPGAAQGAEHRVTRSNLLHYLKHGREGAEYAQEQARKKKLAGHLNAAARQQQLRSIKLPVERSQEWLLKDLANVSIAASSGGGGTMLVVFSDALDLAGQLYKLAEAMGAEWDQFVELCEGKKEKPS
jgi:hypothetical protein